LVLVPVLLSSSSVFLSDEVVRRHGAPDTVELFVLDDDPKRLQKRCLLSFAVVPEHHVLQELIVLLGELGVMVLG